MKNTQRIKNFLRMLAGKKHRRLSPRAAYDSLAQYYDSTYQGLITDSDKILIDSLLKDTHSSFKNSLDYGAGTGQNIPLLSSKTSSDIYAFDISSEMLKILNKKFPFVKLVEQQKNTTLNLEAHSIDLLFCNLCLGYIKDIKALFGLWDEVLTKGATIVLTDIHPQLLANGERSFNLNDKKILINHYVHTLTKIEQFASNLGWEIQAFKEFKVDGQVFRNIGSKAKSRTLMGKNVLYGYRFQTSEN